MEIKLLDKMPLAVLSVIAITPTPQVSNSEIRLRKIPRSKEAVEVIKAFVMAGH
jgi:hypothetical protein